MTSMHGSDSGWNRNYLKIIKNLSHTSKLPYNQISNNYSIMSMIQNNSQFSIFNYIVHIAKYENILNNLSENFTVFVPCDSKLLNKYCESFLTNIDYLDAKNIVMAHIVDKMITTNMINNSETQQLITRHRSGELRSLNTSYDELSNVIMINDSQIIDGDIIMKNGIIHIVNDFLFSQQ